jgi:hypothetical protein
LNSRFRALKRNIGVWVRSRVPEGVVEPRKSAI